MEGRRLGSHAYQEAELVIPRTILRRTDHGMGTMALSAMELPADKARRKNTLDADDAGISIIFIKGT